MSTSIDNRIVEMKFDNDNFEKNVKESQQTLQKFKEALNLTSSAETFNKSMQEAVNGVNFDSMADSLEFLADRFSTLGVIGITVLQNLTNSAIAAASKMVSYMTNAVIQGGRTRAQNIENAKFQLAGFDIEWNQISADINYGVESTAYGLDSAAMAAAQLVASGVEFGETFGDTGNSPMAKALRGISGLASMTNSSYDDMSRIFTTVAGNGRLMGEQLLQISSRGVNAAAKLAEAFNGVNGYGENSAKFLDGISEETQKKIRQLTGGLQITETQLRDFVSKGKIDFAMFSEAMDAAFGEHAKDANDTFQGILSNVRAALAKIGADFWAPILVNKGSLVQMLQSFRLRINDVKEAIRQALGWAADEGGTEYLTRWKDLVDKVFLGIKERLDNVDIQKLTENVKSIIESIVNFGKAMVNIFNVVKELITPIVSSFKKVFDVEGVGTFLTIIEKLTAKFRDFTANIQATQGWPRILLDIKKISDAIFSIVKLGWDILKGVFSVIKSIFSAAIPAGEGVLSIAASFATLITKVVEFIRQSEIIQKAFSFIGTILSSVVGTISKFFTAIKEGFLSTEKSSEKATTGLSALQVVAEKLKAAADWFINKAMPKITEGGSKIGAIFAKLSDVFGSIFSKLIELGKSILPGIGSLLKGILDAVERVFGIIVNTINSLDFSKGFDLVNGGIFAMILLQLKDFISGAKDLAGNVGDILGVLKDGLSGLFGDNGEEAKTNVTNIEKFAIAIGILAGSLAVLASIDSNKLATAFAAIEGLILTMKSVFDTISALPASKGIKGAIVGFLDAFSLNLKMTSLIGFSTAILVLAEAVKVLGQLDIEQLAKGIAGITAIMLDLVLVSEMLSRNDTKMVKGSVGLIALGAAIVILAEAVKIMAQLSWEQLAIGLVGLTAILVDVAGFAVLMNATASDLTRVGLAMIPFAAGVVILAQAVKQLADLSWEDLAKGLSGFTVILAGVAGFAALTEKSATAITKIGLALIPFAAGVIIIAQAVKQLADLSWSELAVGLTGFAAIMTVIAGFAILLNATATSLTSVGLALIPFAAGVVILAQAVKQLAGLSWSDLLKGLTGLATILGTVGALALVMNATQSSLAKTAAGLLVFAAALAIIVPEFKALGNMSWENITKAILALAAALTVLGVAGVILSGFAKEIALAGAAIAAFGAGIAIVGVGILSLASGLTALGVALGTLGSGITTLIKEILHLIPDIIQTFGDVIESFAEVIANAIPSLVKAFAAVIEGICEAILEAVPTILKTIVQLLDSLIEYVPQIIDKVITMIVKIIEGVADRMPDLVNAIAKLVKAFFDAVMDLFKDVTLTELVAAIKDLSSVALYLAIVGEMGAAALKGIVILAAIIVALGAITVGLGALVKAIPDLEELLTRGIPILSKIGYAIGEFVGNLVGGFLGGLSNALPEIADNLSSFMKKLQPFIDGARSVDSAVAKGALYLAETILVLTATSIINGIAKFLGGDSDFGKLGKQLVPFGEAMADFAEAVKGIDPEVVESAANAGKMIAEMAASLPNEGGLLGKIVGENSMGLIGPQLKDFGQALKDFSDVITEGGGINAEAVQSAANAGKAIAEMASELPNEGGLLAEIVGDNSLGIIGPQLADFGKSLKDFSDAIVGFDPEAVTAAANAGKALAEMADTVPNSGGLVAFFTGENDLGEFGEKLPQFGEDLVEFSNSVADFKTEGVAASTEAGKMLTEMAATIPNTGGLVSWFTGNNDLDDFGEKLASFGTNLVEYSESVSGFKEEGVTASVTAGKALVEMAATIPNTGGLVSFFAGNNGLKDFGNALPDFGKSIKSYADNVSGIVTTGLEASVLTAAALANIAATIPDSGGILSIFGGDNDFGKFGGSLLQFATSLVTYSQEVAKVDYPAVDTATSEITKLIEMFKNLKAVDPSIASNFKMALEQIASAGIKGFTNTFSKATTDVKTVSKEVKEATLDGFKNIDHDLYKKGESASKSFVNGFEKNKSTAKSSASALADSVTEGLKKAEKNAKDSATNAINAFLKAFADQQQTAYNKGVLVGQKAADGIKSINFYNIGVNAMQGFINGMGAMYWNVYNSAYSVASAASLAAKNVLKERSPSRVMMEIGEYAGEGLAIGMTDSTDMVESSATNMSKAALQSVAKTISKMRDVIDDDLDIQPVITPVLDTSQIQNGIGIINGIGSGVMLGASSLGIAGGLSYTSPYYGYDRYNDSKVVEAINSLESRLDSAVSRMENLQIVLDTGTLVGETAPVMNDEFGNMDVLVQRGVM